jgi:dihydroxyacetone kinase
MQFSTLLILGIFATVHVNASFDTQAQAALEPQEETPISTDAAAVQKAIEVFEDAAATAAEVEITRTEVAAKVAAAIGPDAAVCAETYTPAECASFAIEVAASASVSAVQVSAK